jgi:hypothetical protein
MIPGSDRCGERPRRYAWQSRRTPAFGPEAKKAGGAAAKGKAKAQDDRRLQREAESEGDSGIGRAVAVLYAREGADVAIVYLSEDEDADETRQAVEAEGRRAILIPGDVTDSAFCRDAVEQTVRELGGLDILVNNAAFQEHVPSLENVTDEQLDRTFRTSICGYFYMARAALAQTSTSGAFG